MKFIALLLLATMFVGTPMVLFDTLVLPQMEQLQYTYDHADEIAQKVTNSK